MYLSDAEKIAIIVEYKKGKSRRMIASMLKINLKTVCLWINRYNDEGHLRISTHTRGRKAKLSDEQARDAASMLLSGHYTSKQAAIEMSKQVETQVSYSSILRHAKRVAIKDGAPIQAVRKAPVKQLSPSTISKRMEFCQQNKTRNWSNVLFLDRKKFLFTYPKFSVPQVGWVREGEARVAPKVNHPMCVNVYCGLTKFGTTKCHIVAGTSKHKSPYLNQAKMPSKNITIAEYSDVLFKTLLPSANTLFTQSHGISTFLVLQDNDPTHKKGSQQALNRWREEHMGHPACFLDGYPPNSPDLNPIENLWSWVGRQVNKKGCQDFDSFQEEVIKTLESVPKSLCAKLVGSMKKRVAQVIKSKGQKIKY